MNKNINEVNLYGFPQGDVDSGNVVLGGTDGNWGGSMERALEIASFAKACGGKNPSSQKRSKVKTASGNVSDHYEGNPSAYAVDIPASGTQGDELLKCIMGKFNGGRQAGYKGGEWLNVPKDGYRYQFGWRVPNHYDHIHIGVIKGGGGSDKVIPLDNTDSPTDNSTSDESTIQSDLVSALSGTIKQMYPGLNEELERIKKIMK